MRASQLPWTDLEICAVAGCDLTICRSFMLVPIGENERKRQWWRLRWFMTAEERAVASALRKRRCNVNGLGLSRMA